MKLGALFILAATLSAPAVGSTITVEITGVTSNTVVDEGPIFGYSSYKHIPDGTAFTLIYTFDDTKGQESLSDVVQSVITQSTIEATNSSSPGTNATLQIGKAMWEFGESTKAEVKLNTSASVKSEEFTFVTAGRGNRVSMSITPGKGSYWPRNGDWRASFSTNSLDGSGSFSADNNQVSAKGKLIPSTITVLGADLVGQSLSSKTTAGGAGSTNWERQWRLALESPKGGYVVQRVTRTIMGKKPDGSPVTPSSVEYWEAWQVVAGSQITIPAEDSFAGVAPAGSVGSDSVSATARFYEGLTLPSSFAVGNSPYAGSIPSSTKNPNLPTNYATLPVVASATLHF